MSDDKVYFMRRAIELAKTAVGHTSPNPMVGCVITKNGRIISEACHEKCGEFHAERNALLRCKEDTTGAELYVTLEPCCHYGKTPPCTEIIIEKGISKVYVGCLDSNPLVAGKGIEILRKHNIEVETGLLEKECREMNEIFFYYINNGVPFVAMKYAMTIDGKIAAYTGDSKWVTGEESRNYVQLLRKKYSGILVGINTVIADNPMLNCRIEDNVDPVRIICDSKLNIPLDCNIVKTSKTIKTIVAYSKKYENESLVSKIKQLSEFGVELIEAGNQDMVDMKILLKELGNRKIDSVLVEGGAEINSSILKSGYVNKVYAFIAPKIIMGRESKTPVAGEGIQLMKDALVIKNKKIKEIGEDILIEGYL